MIDPITALGEAIDSAQKVANTALFTTVIDKVTGFKISKWAAEGEVRKKLIHDEYEKAKKNGIMGAQYINNLRNVTNLIDTAVKSAKYVELEKPNEIKIDNDFFWNAIEHSKTVSSKEMQELIAKIIAGEYNSPETYSISTLQVIKMLDKNSLKLFEKVCCLLIADGQLPSDLFSGKHNLEDFMRDSQIDFKQLQLLQSLQLFFPNQMSREIPNLDKKDYGFSYFDKQLVYQPENENITTIKIPNFYGLSPVGEQILNHLSPSFIGDYYTWLKANYKIRGYKLKE